MSDDTNSSPPDRPPVRHGGLLRRRLVRFVLLLVVPIVAIIIGMQIYLTSGRYISTENAYVKAPLIVISAEVSGRAQRIFVQENQLVQKGTLLLELDPEPFVIALAGATAAIVAARQEIEGRRAELRQVEARIAAARERVSYLQRQLKRERTLRAQGASRAARFDKARYELTVARQDLVAVRQSRLRVLAGLGGDSAMRSEVHPLFLAAKARLDKANLDLKRTTIRASGAGVVAKISLEPGEYVANGKPLFVLVDDSKVWIEANLKETQLTNIKVGQTAYFEVDAYPDQEWRATVIGISPATGAEFALLPPQNASGNWVKVVQRLPIRVRVVPGQVGAPKLRAGMTVTLRIDTEFERALPSLIKKVLAISPIKSWRDTINER